MTINRKELKTRGHEVLQNNYWKTCFLSGLMLVLSYGTVFTIITNFAQDAPKAVRDTYENLQNMKGGFDLKVAAVMIVLLFGILILNTIFKIAVNIFVKNPVEVGVRFFMKNGQDLESVGMISDVAYGFDHAYGNIVKCMLLKQISEFLWGLLLIVPGVMKSYAYRMTPYLLSEDPDMTPVDALNKSSQMMMGYKKEALLLDLSFIPWHIAGIASFGILELFFVLPYKYQTDAAFYEKVKAVYTAA